MHRLGISLFPRQDQETELRRPASRIGTGTLLAEQDGKMLKGCLGAPEPEREMAGQPGRFRRRMIEIVAIFREKGATSPEKALTARELGLSPRFDESMRRHLRASGIFVEVGGRYCLDEARLKQIEDRQGCDFWGRRGFRRRITSLRIIRMVVGIVTILLVVANLFVLESMKVRYLVLALVILWVVLTVFEINHLSRARSRLGGGMRAIAAAS